jgi:transposase-like protein
MLLDDEEQRPQKELVYDARKDIDDEDKPNEPAGVFDPQQKITAVLSIWSERRTSAQVCQQMDISPALLGQWQNLAIEGMLKALDPTTKARLPPLNHRLTRLIEKKLSEPGKLEKRLQSIQKAASAG